MSGTQAAPVPDSTWPPAADKTLLNSGPGAPNQRISPHWIQPRSRGVGRQDNMTSRPPLRLTHLTLALSLALQPLAGVHAETAPDAALADLPLEELMGVEIVSAGRKSQALGEVAAAVFVITQDDILRSGARTLPEALRLAPGVDVAQLQSGRWAVGVRGGARRFANNLQVLIDGRSVYSPLFSGVLWEAERVPVDNIERIEIIRGPAGAVWGANAVNGVINIITKDADRTPGTQASVTVGSDRQAAVTVRHGLALTMDSHLRLWAEADGGGQLQTTTGNDANDSYRTTSAGARLDRGLEGGAQLSVQGQLLRSRVNDRWQAFDADTPGYSRNATTRQNLDRAMVMGHLRKPLEDGSELRLTASLLMERGDQRDYVTYRDHAFDFDAQHRWQPAKDHDLTWGAGFNWYRDKLGNSDLLAFNPDSRSMLNWRLYAQDEWALQPQKWLLTYGLRVDRDPYAGAQVQPNARLLWKIDPKQSAWIAASRAVRATSRAEEDATIDAGVYAPAVTGAPFPTRVRLTPPGDDKSTVVEKVTALETGWRGQVTHTLSLDTTVFVHRYSPLIESAQPTAVTSLDVVMGPWGPYLLANMNRLRGSATTRGFELAADWRVQPGWRLQASYAFLDVDSTGAADIAYEGLSASPRNLLSLRSAWDLSSTVTLDAWLRYTGRRDYVIAQFGDVGSRTTLDMNVRWRARPGVVLSAAGHNLGPKRRQEIAQDYGFSASTQAERALVLKAELSY